MADYLKVGHLYPGPDRPVVGLLVERSENPGSILRRRSGCVRKNGAQAANHVVEGDHHRHTSAQTPFLIKYGRLIWTESLHLLLPGQALEL